MAKLRNQLPIHSLQTKIFLICLTTALSILLVSVYTIYRAAVSSIEKNAIQYIFENIKYANDSVNVMLDDAMSVSLVLAMNRDIVPRVINRETQTASYDWFLDKLELERFLSSLMQPNDSISMIAVVCDNGRVYQVGGVHLIRDITTQDWFASAQKMQQGEIRFDAEQKRVYLFRPYFQLGKQTATILMELDYSALVRAHNIAPLENVQTFTYTGDGDIVFSTAGEQTGRNIHTLLSGESLPAETHSGYQTIEGQKSLLVQYRDHNRALATLGYLSYQELIGDALEVRKRTTYIAIAAVLIAGLAAGFFARVICRNLLEIAGSMARVENGDLSVRSSINSADETGDISRVFNHMMDRIEALVQDVKEQEAQKTQLQQDVLYAQIQPHFLCNAINSMQYIARGRGQDDIAEVASSLSTLVRGVLSSREDFISLLEERVYIDKYFDIQRFKYMSDFLVSWEVETSIWSYKIPRFLLQPLAENALLHGLSERTDGTIQIKAYRDKDGVVIQVIDNGKGMSPDEIDSLTKRIPEPSQFRRVGVSNVIERISLIYGDSASFRVDSRTNAYTCVELRLPIRKEP